MSDKIAFNKALLWILVSTLLISGSAFMGWLYFLHIRERRLNDDQYRIAAIIQRTSQSNTLKSVYLAELLNLSLDRPSNLYQFNTKEAGQILIQNPLIESAVVKKILPGTLFISYEMRTPIAYIGDLANTGVDEQGYLFPFRPFFTPKRLPTIYLGLNKEQHVWGISLMDSPALTLAFTVLRKFNQLKLKNLELTQLDVSQAQSDSYGQRQIVLVLEEHSQIERFHYSKVFLRLNPDYFIDNLANFCTLHTNYLEKKIEKKKIEIKDNQSIIIDLRIPHLAFIKIIDFQHNK